MKIYDCAEAGLSAIPTDVPNDALALGLSKNALKDSLKRSSWGGMVCSGGDATDNCAQYTAKGTCEAGPCVNGGAGAPAAGCNAGKCTWGSTAAVMGRTAGLLQLDLSGNSLTALEADALQNLPKLVRLDLSANEIASVHSNAFDHVPDLRTLSLRGNRLAAVDVTMFAKLVKLERLDLGDNLLTSLPAGAAGGAFDGVAKLQWLSLRGNAITEIPLQTFNRPLELRSLDLFDNAIPRFDTRTWDNLTHLEVLRLSNATQADVGVVEEDIVSCDGRPGLTKAIHFGPYNREDYDKWLQQCGIEPGACFSHCITPVTRNVCANTCAPGTSLRQTARLCRACFGKLAHDHHCSMCCDSALDANNPVPCDRYVDMNNFTTAGFVPSSCTASNFVGRCHNFVTK